MITKRRAVITWLAICFIYTLAVLAVLFLAVAAAEAGHCKQFFVKKQVVAKQVVVKQQVIQEHVVAPIYAVKVPVYYGVGANLQYQALGAKAQANEDLHDFFQAYQSWKEQQRRDFDSEPQRPEPPQLSILAQKCAACHGTQLSQPKGGLFLDARDGIPADLITAALRQVRDDKMPPDKPLNADEKAELMQELLQAERRE